MSETTDTATGNLPELTVSELAGAVKRTVETAFGRVRVRGEITEMKTYASGHTYMALKDEGAKIRAIIWRGNAARLGLKPENGVEVIATGRITTYPERSEYQLIIERLDYAGEGALLARIEKLRLRLTEEGLFDAARKRALPLLPRIVGVVSSPQGAVIQDIRTTIARRFPRRIILWPVAVQGEAAAAQIAAAIRGFGALPEAGEVPRPDVLIVARGGGSLEDLMAFNDEEVVRAAASCPIPLISAVGHETDTTLIDFASDRRAPTPTAAAELAVPDRMALAADLAQSGARLTGALTRVTQSVRLRLDRAAAALPDLPSMIGTARQRLDDRGERLALALPRLVAAKRAQAREVAARLVHPREIIAARRHSLALLGQRLAAPAPGLLRENRLRLGALAARLEALSYHATLARGFVMVATPSGDPVTTRRDAGSKRHLVLHFGDGTLGVRPEADRAPPAQTSLDL
ncbi:MULTISPECIES: exodeoxyribonuclease VII large subunit [Acidiphilium]|jgi:exodeoxyribonuclease VII large subunit|uniref:Exodeoxyribonuclease 7 large subunit n=6 Tax=Acidiphilium TaxID=522 RepID=A5FY60_ACICJ|nr:MULTISPECIES: exodeoxyribonuclease VII large subunit [Acidiphilium]ABQ30542.1 exodeoxyribonuclease VII, large subunit [Acidiphilium cryptum JF-5]MBS3022475.1 exodeoxyribonuclease VII large subunit [Acidiphilium multivorum]UNC15404.1 exodeoxyribonuclease VII large subunit [Acidiphilium multivorum]BAJ80724.1 exodeoxyribonuclease VII large subunit [Acidiphilium multivorum AIU301]GAN75674.1 exodeoxyribonuclease VII large subunit [Acidiphilium multivorum AIU301]